MRTVAGRWRMNEKAGQGVGQRMWSCFGHSRSLLCELGSSQGCQTCMLLLKADCWLHGLLKVSSSI